MGTTSTVRKDLIPYEAGVVILVPLDANKRPDYSRAVATKRDFLTSTQTSVTRTTETLANGNGADKDFITDERYQLTVTGNTYNPEFHAAVAGRFAKDATDVLIPREHSFTMKDGTSTVTFGTGKDIVEEPAANADGKYDMIVEDAYGNTMTPTTGSSTPTEGTYRYDSDTKTLTFPTAMAGATVRVIFYVKAAKGYTIENNPILTTPEYMIQCFGVTMSAGADTKYRVVTTIKRASTTGDISEQTTQKAKSAPITYTFQSNPVPAGESVYSQVFTTVEAE